MLAANHAGTLLLKRAMEHPTPLAGGAVALASTAAAVEVFGWSERHADSPVSEALKLPGHELRRVRHARARRTPTRSRPRGARRDRAAWRKTTAVRRDGNPPGAK